MVNMNHHVKDMCLANVIMGVKIIRPSNELGLSQTYYIDKILEKFNKSDSNVVRTPIDVNLHLSTNGGERRIPVGVFLYNMEFNVLNELITTLKWDCRY